MNETPNSFEAGNPNPQNYGYNPYNHNNYGYQGYNPNYAYERFLKHEQDKKTLKKLSLCAGGAVLLYILVQNIMLVLLQPFGLLDAYYDNPIFKCAYDIVLTIIGMYLPFAFIGRRMKKISAEPEPVPLGKPQGGFNTLLAVVAGLGVCMIANYVTSFVTIFMALFGFELSSPEIGMPTGVLGVALNIARLAVVAAVVEELALRGFVMGNLRRYGDTFAIFMSAFVFAAMHGNLIQAPFALVAGFGLGYFSVKTNSLWTGILIHGFNNLISTVVSYLLDVVPEEMLNSVYVMLVYGLIGLGIICFIAFNNRTRHIPLRRNETSLSTGECVRYYLLSPTMILSLFFMLYVTITYISNNSAP